MITKAKLKAEIDRLNTRNTYLETKYEHKEAELATKQNEVSALYKKVQDMKNTLARYEEMFYINSNWDCMNYSVTNLAYDYASNPIHMIVEFDIVPAPIPEEENKS